MRVVVKKKVNISSVIGNGLFPICAKQIITV